MSTVKIMKKLENMKKNNIKKMKKNPCRGKEIDEQEDDKDRNGFYQIFARGFDPDGSERFPDMTVNTAGSGQQLWPDIAVADGGGFVVVWEDDQDKNGFYQIFARGFKPDGTESFTVMTVNTAGSGQQLLPAVAIDNEGGFVVVWEDDKDKNGYYQIFARGFHADGSERFPDMTVNTAGSGQQLWPEVAMAADGSFFVVWQDDKDKNGYYQIFARGFNANGSQRFADITVNKDASGQ